MKITRISPMSGLETTYDLPVTIEQMNEFQTPNHKFIQDIFPNLERWQREFIKTGYDLEDQNMLFSMGLSRKQIAEINKQFKSDNP